MSARTTLLQPLRVSVALATIALTLSLGFLALTAWHSAYRLSPLENHVRQIQGLQQTDIAIGKLLTRHLASHQPPTAMELEHIRADLDDLLQQNGQLSPNTPNNLRMASDYLALPIDNPSSNLIGALSLIRKVLTQENALQQQAIKTARQSADQEFTIALIALIATPILAIAVMIWFRRRAFRAVSRLSELLDNVASLRFVDIEPVSENDPLAPIYQHYNEMTASLRTVSQQSRDHTDQLESQVRAASETLLRQQAELENGAKMAAIGEFSARLAHELRNPVSGISMALHNMEIETKDPDHRERLALIAEEMDRVTRLLNSLLQNKSFTLETPVAVSSDQLIGDVVKLFGYRLPKHVAITVDSKNHNITLPRDTVRQVLLNLLKNSCEALGDLPGTITVSFDVDNNTACLTVTDTGPGYADAMIARGVRPFQSGKADGVGLGLSIVQHLVHGTGGDIQLGRSTNGGAMTIIHFPCEEPDHAHHYHH
ncbi:hypothetical protein TMES_06155 [Thalassospira mesophila]|uniref:histidine kinase n=2 Tax=Thalassospira mesophila TaxID=1293891 RepID=A0A1Y2L270_9PROT|nr:hypothetical protein TMES_06155 [Thalassospira mesophila]